LAGVTVSEEAIERMVALRRTTNVEIAGVARSLALEAMPFLCECRRPDCTARIEVPLGEFVQVCADGGYFVATGHEAEADEVVARRRAYLRVRTA
jgi:hypothetical protein